MDHEGYTLSQMDPSPLPVLTTTGDCIFLGCKNSFFFYYLKLRANGFEIDIKKLRVEKSVVQVNKCRFS